MQGLIARQKWGASAHACVFPFIRNQSCCNISVRGCIVFKTDQKIKIPLALILRLEQFNLLVRKESYDHEVESGDIKCLIEC